MILALVLGVVIGEWTDDESEPSSAPTAAPAAAADAEYREALDAEAMALADARAAALERFRAAENAKGQGAASRALALTYSRASARVARLRPPAALLQAHRQLEKAIRTAAEAYRRLAAAASGSRRPAYESGRKRVRRAEALLRQEFREALDQPQAPSP